MVKRYTANIVAFEDIDAIEFSTRPGLNGEWVKYEDVKELLWEILVADFDGDCSSVIFDKMGDEFKDYYLENAVDIGNR